MRPSPAKRAANSHERGNHVRLSKLSIRNFRNFTTIDIPLAGNVVLLGENRVGKSNLLFAIRLVLESPVRSAVWCSESLSRGNSLQRVATGHRAARTGWPSGAACRLAVQPYREQTKPVVRTDRRRSLRSIGQYEAPLAGSPDASRPSPALRARLCRVQYDRATSVNAGDTRVLQPPR